MQANPMLAKRTLVATLLLALAAQVACTGSPASDASMTESVWEGSSVREFSVPCLAMRYVGPPTRPGEPPFYKTPRMFSQSELEAILARPMPDVGGVAAGTTAREVLERVSGLKFVWTPMKEESGGEHEADRKIRTLTYAALVEWHVGDERYITASTNVAANGKKLGELLGTFVDIIGRSNGAMRPPASDEGARFETALMVTPEGMQFIQMLDRWDRLP